jgi:hypothetical protein
LAPSQLIASVTAVTNPGSAQGHQVSRTRQRGDGPDGDGERGPADDCTGSPPDNTQRNDHKDDAEGQGRPGHHDAAVGRWLGDKVVGSSAEAHHDCGANGNE